MLMPSGKFDPSARAQAKKLARENDELELANGHVSAEELRRRNSFVKGVDFSRARILSRVELDAPAR